MFGIFSKRKREAANLLISPKAESRPAGDKPDAGKRIPLLGQFFGSKKDKEEQGAQAPGVRPEKKKAAAKSTKAAKGKGKSSSSLAPGASDLLSIDNSTDVLVFGMRWRTLVTSGSTREAMMKMALKEGASHFTRQRQQIGYCLLPALEPGMTLYPAALLAAKNHAGDALYVLNTGDGEGNYWVARTRGGHPTSLDEFIVGSQEQVLERVRTLVTEGDADEIQIFTNLTGVIPAPNVRDFSVQDLFDITRSIQESLQSVVKPKRSIPKPVLISLVGGLAVLGVQYGYQYWTEYKAAEARRLSQASQQTPEEAWAPVIARFESGLNQVNANGLGALRAGIYKAPVLWNGWLLKSIKCKVNPSGSNEKSIVWLCLADYQRGRVALTNDEMLERDGSKWNPKFIDIGLMQISWDLTLDRIPMRVADLKNHVSQQIASVSSVQNLLPALTTPPAMVFKPIELPAPKNQQGMAIPKPASIPSIFQMPVAIKGPLRSIEAVIEEVPGVDWNSLEVTYVGGAERAVSSGLLSTSFISEISGVAYAK